MEKGIHYRTGGRLTHVGCECLPEGKDIPFIVIEKIEYLEQAEVNGRRESNVWIATFAKNPYTNLPMVLNATNRKRIAKLYPNCDGYINLLKNIPVRLTREKCRDVQDGGTTWGLRISKIPAAPAPAPAPAPVPAPATTTAVKKEDLNKENPERWAGAIKFIKENGVESIEKIKKTYNVSPEIEQLLIKESKGNE